MFHNNKPIFASGVVLKANMLEIASMYPRHMMDIMYSKYSDGILSGVEISVEDRSTIRLSKGIMKLQGNIYYMEEDKCIKVQPNIDTQYLKIRVKEKEMQADMERFETEYVIDTQMAEENEFEICRFVLNEGAILRTDYTDLRDYATMHNTINILETKYSAIGKSTVNPKFLLEFGRQMYSCNLTNVDDVVFVTECLKEENIKREIIEKYIWKRLGEGNREYSNQEIYRKLIEILDIVKRGEVGGGMQGRMQPRRLLVD
ncbi:MAG: hypothetical protein IJD58_12600 [Lachnospiraceae bacterium]|nr:hypothetical protein [Lachnospiraceae bacterium]